MASAPALFRKSSPGAVPPADAGELPEFDLAAGLRPRLSTLSNDLASAMQDEKRRRSFFSLRGIEIEN